MDGEKYKELFLKLAYQLGWTDVLIREEGAIRGVYGRPPTDIAKLYGIKEDDTIRASMPNWAIDNGHALALALEHNIEITPLTTEVWAGESGTHRFGKWETIADHPDKGFAARYAICSAVLSKLEYISIL